MRAQNAPGRSGEPATAPTGLRRVVTASMAGTVVEWYEFFLYGTAATLVFSKIFFAEGTSELDAILAAFVTYAVGFAARPLGGIVFGHFGDRYGRKKLLQFSLLLVGGATFLMGCLPTFGQIGYWAPTLLVLLRFIQGFAVGGEWGGAVLLVAEHSPNRSRGFWASWPQAGVPMGNLLATLVLLALTSTLSEAAFLSWGWRVAFWLSAVVVLVGYYVRTKVTDAPIFVEAQQQAERAKASSFSVVEVLKRYPRGVFTAMGLRFGENIMYYLVVTFTITYLKVQVGVDTSVILWWLLAAHAVHFFAIPLAGRLSDKIGRRPVYLAGAITAGSWGFFAFPMMDSGHNAVIMAAIIIGLVFHALMYASQPAIMAEMFPTRMRYSGVSLGYQVTSIVAGSLAPIIAVRLLDSFDSAVPIAWYLAAACAVTAIAVIVARETRGVDLTDVDEADAAALASGQTPAAVTTASAAQRDSARRDAAQVSVE
ncbi:MHS family MFS transporter [Nocardia puris]|uniref:Putative MFS family arabinose efflux permease n=1 Tax=Nocardia puris TaxID=208602 RepID=A0A366D936_9NOCA|nr:MFS transporter [Nocardia puris]MBF6214006.1 MHS family MFS transporter [Nocardia puris]MBF6368697.1 MHS family MFS transporter [Nocardia puris]MBF6461612.1 MHS family MFS transporter [Nocardia puris]RBO86516.1 putative MFS family arabinose efflux permease [Nocardia puris]